MLRVDFSPVPVPAKAKSDVPPLILVIDDEASELSRLSSVVESRFIGVETVSSGDAAVRRIRRLPAPNLVLLDLAAPGMDGLKALKQVRNLQPDLRVGNQPWA